MESEKYLHLINKPNKKGFASKNSTSKKGSERIGADLCWVRFQAKSKNLLYFFEKC